MTEKTAFILQQPLQQSDDQASDTYKEKHYQTTRGNTMCFVNVAVITDIITIIVNGIIQVPKSKKNISVCPQFSLFCNSAVNASFIVFVTLLTGGATNTPQENMLLTEFTTNKTFIKRT